MKDYFSSELGIPVFHQPQEFQLNDTRFLIGHGDGLGPNDKGYKRMKKVFTNPFFQTLFRWFHPDLGVALAQYLSTKNKLISGDEDQRFLGEDEEWLAQYSRRKEAEQHRDYYVFGHRHLPLEIPINATSVYMNIGDWITHYTYAEFSEGKLSLKTWEGAKG